MTMRKNIVKYVALTVLGICLYGISAEFAVRERGYFAVGGEFFLLLLPVFYYLFAEMTNDIRSDVRDAWKELRKR